MRSRKLINALWRMCVVLLVIYILFGYKYKIVYNVGDSMHPTYSHGEWVITEKIYNPTKNWVPNRFDTVIVWDTQDKLTKRIIGLEGDEVSIKYGKIFLNGKEIKGQYGKGNIIYYTEDEDVRAKKPKNEWLFFNTDQLPKKVPKGFIWVIGDNREISWYGLVPIKGVRGLVIF